MISIICATVQDLSDRDFMLWLYKEFEGLMYATAQKYITIPDAVEDIVQESVVKLIAKVSLLRKKDRYTLVNYIIITVRHTAINHLKAKYKEQKYTTAFQEAQEPDSAARPLSLDEMLIIKEQKIRLSQIWPQLPEADQLLLEGKYILKYSDAELAKQLNCKASSIRMKLTRARRNALELVSK